MIRTLACSGMLAALAGDGCVERAAKNGKEKECFNRRADLINDLKTARGAVVQRVLLTAADSKTRLLAHAWNISHIVFLL